VHSTVFFPGSGMVTDVMLKRVCTFHTGVRLVETRTVHCLETRTVFVAGTVHEIHYCSYRVVGTVL
jgi:hypothetical protein